MGERGPDPSLPSPGLGLACLWSPMEPGSCTRVEAGDGHQQVSAMLTAGESGARRMDRFAAHLVPSTLGLKPQGSVLLEIVVLLNLDFLTNDSLSFFYYLTDL